MRRFFWIRIAIFLRQSRWGFALLALWFAIGTFAFAHFANLSLREAFLSALYLRVHSGPLWELYSFWGQCVLFGIIISLFFLQAIQRYNPQEACRMLASKMKDHVIVVGHSHLGARIVDHLRLSSPLTVILERDGDYPSMDSLLMQTERARQAMVRGRARRAAQLEVFV